MNKLRQFGWRCFFFNVSSVWEDLTSRNLSVSRICRKQMVMVGGWVAGDFFKLCYFMMNLFEGGNSGNVVFIWGCLFSLALDSIVGIQMARQKPEILDLWKRVLRLLRHGKTAIGKRASENRGRGMMLSPYHPSPVSGGLLGPNPHRVG